MSHEIEFNETKGTHSFASHAEVAWHGLGTVVNKAMTAEEAIELANLDYTVARTEAMFKVDDKEFVSDKWFANYRTDNNAFLGMVKSRYQIVQNREAFSFFDSIVDSGEAIFETAGVLGRGERIFITAKLPDDILVNGDKVNKYIILTNTHDATTSIVAGFTTVRVVCNNTLQAAMRGLSNRVSISHTMSVKEKLREAYKVMGLASSYMTEINGIFNKMADCGLNDDELMEFIESVFEPTPRQGITPATPWKPTKWQQQQMDAVYSFAKNHPTQNTSAAKDTMWGAYNSISGYLNYIKKHKTNEDKMTNQLFGDGNTLMVKAFNHATALIN